MPSTCSGTSSAATARPSPPGCRSTSSRRSPRDLLRCRNVGCRRPWPRNTRPDERVGPHGKRDSAELWIVCCTSETSAAAGHGPCRRVRVSEYTTDEMMAVAAARRLADGDVCFVGIGLPSKAANLARATHAPGCVLIYESGTIGAKPEHLPLSIGDGELAETADVVVSVPEIFAY